MNTSTTAVGTGPYYVLAFPSGGFASTSLVGTDPKNLSWQVKYPAGMSTPFSSIKYMHPHFIYLQGPNYYLA